MSELVGKLAKSQKNFFSSLKTGFTPQQILLNLFLEVMQEPIQDFSGMLLNPFVEQFTEISAPIVEQLSEIMANLATFVIDFLVVMWPSVKWIIQNAQDFIDVINNILDLFK